MNESAFDLGEILESVRETAYRWDFASDRIDWAENVEAALGVKDPAQLRKGRAFALLVDPEYAGARAPRQDRALGRKARCCSPASTISP
jgi:hypothetical protein